MTRLVLVAAVAAALAAPAAGALAPSLKLTATKPLTVAGTHFRPHEHVTVTVAATERLVRRVTATRRGTFDVELGDAALGRCGGLSISASGSGGSRAALKLPRPACMPAKTP
jgi:hypothetical protein